MSYTLIILKDTFCCLDDILIVRKGSEEDHFEMVTVCLEIINADSVLINLTKCYFAKQEFLWLGYNITQSGISPLESKTSAILSLQPFKKLCSCLGSVHYISKFSPNLAKLCHTLRPLLRKSTKDTWTYCSI